MQQYVVHEQSLELSVFQIFLVGWISNQAVGFPSSELVTWLEFHPWLDFHPCRDKSYHLCIIRQGGWSMGRDYQKWKVCKSIILKSTWMKLLCREFERACRPLKVHEGGCHRSPAGPCGQTTGPHLQGSGVPFGWRQLKSETSSMTHQPAVGSVCWPTDGDH